MKKNPDLMAVRHIKTVTIGAIDPSIKESASLREEQVRKLNEALEGPPKGTIIGKDVDFSVLAIGEHQVILQSTTYHIGYVRRNDY